MWIGRIFTRYPREIHLRQSHMINSSIDHEMARAVCRKEKTIFNSHCWWPQPPITTKSVEDLFKTAIVGFMPGDVDFCFYNFPRWRSSVSLRGLVTLCYPGIYITSVTLLPIGPHRKLHTLFARFNYGDPSRRIVNGRYLFGCPQLGFCECQIFKIQV